MEEQPAGVDDSYMTRLAKSLETLRSQANKAWPNRSKKSDGWIGDVRHQKAGTSDHLPNKADVVTAIDITHDPANGLHARELADALVASRDPRLKYVISEGQICSSKQTPWVWRHYKGRNGHFHHVHISVMADKVLYDDSKEWVIESGGTLPHPPIEPPTARPLLKRGSKGEAVVLLQRRLSIKADGDFGPATEIEVKTFQKQKGLPVDGIVGPETWKKLLQI